MPRLTANNIDIEYEEYGDAGDPAVLLIMGLASQLTHWPESFICSLVENNYRVIAFDNRDIGLSEKLHSKHTLPPFANLAVAMLFGRSLFTPYTLSDMADDAVGVLDVLEIEQSHVIGVSMGGMIGQLLAARYKEKVKSLTTIMSSTNNPTLPRAKSEITRKVFASTSTPKTFDDVVNQTVELRTLIGTKNSGHDPGEFRDRIEAAVKRCHYPAGVRRQTAAIIASGDLRKWSRRVDVDTLVIHGSDDPLAPVQGGLDIAANIPNAQVKIIDGMGHDLPPRHLPTITEFVTDHLHHAENGI